MYAFAKLPAAFCALQATKSYFAVLFIMYQPDSAVLLSGGKPTEIKIHDDYTGYH